MIEDQRSCFEDEEVEPHEVSAKGGKKGEEGVGRGTPLRFSQDREVGGQAVVFQLYSYTRMSRPGA